MSNCTITKININSNLLVINYNCKSGPQPSSEFCLPCYQSGQKEECNAPCNKTEKVYATLIPENKKEKYKIKCKYCNKKKDNNIGLLSQQYNYELLSYLPEVCPSDEKCSKELCFDNTKSTSCPYMKGYTNNDPCNFKGEIKCCDGNTPYCRYDPPGKLYAWEKAYKNIYPPGCLKKDYEKFAIYKDDNIWSNTDIAKKPLGGKPYYLGIWCEQLWWFSINGIGANGKIWLQNFKIYLNNYKNYVVNNNIDRAYFIISDPAPDGSPNVNNFTKNNAWYAMFDEVNIDCLENNNSDLGSCIKYIATDDKYLDTVKENINNTNIKLLVDYFIDYFVLNMPNNVELGMVVDASNQYSWTWLSWLSKEKQIPGGWNCSNGGINSDYTKKVRGRPCSCVKCNSQGKSNQTLWLEGSTTFNGSCPNSFELVSLWIQLLQMRIKARHDNATDKKKYLDINGNLRQITALSADAECLSAPYGKNPPSALQWGKALQYYCKVDNSLFNYRITTGYASGTSERPKITGFDEVFPEYYWFGEFGGHWPQKDECNFLEEALGYSVCKARTTTQPVQCNCDYTKNNFNGLIYTDHCMCGGPCPGVKEENTRAGLENPVGCSTTIFTNKNYLNKPETILKTYWGKGYLETKIGSYQNGELKGSDYWPLISLENISYNKKTGRFSYPKGDKECVDKYYGRTNKDACGTMASLSNWSKESVNKLLSLTQKKYGINHFILYQYSFIPKGWFKGGEFIPIED